MPDSQRNSAVNEPVTYNTEEEAKAAVRDAVKNGYLSATRKGNVVTFVSQS